MRSAAAIVDEESLLVVQQWASSWLGAAWLDAEDGERELLLEVAERVTARPSPQGLAAVAALRRVADPGDFVLLDEAIGVLSADEPVPSWLGEPAAEPVKAWRAVDVWDSEHVLFVEYGGEAPHTLVTQLLVSGGVLIEKLALLGAGAVDLWESSRQTDAVPVPLTECPTGEVLAELADALRSTDMTLPRQDDEDFVDLRALAWSRSRAHLPGFSDPEPLGEAERRQILDDFGPEDDLAELFLEYGEGYITSGPLYWSPNEVGLFLADWLPRKRTLDAEQRAALPDALRRWIRFALQRRGVEDRWITPVVDAVDEFLPDFAEAFDEQQAGQLIDP